MDTFGVGAGQHPDTLSQKAAVRRQWNIKAALLKRPCLLFSVTLPYCSCFSFCFPDSEPRVPGSVPRTRPIATIILLKLLLTQDDLSFRVFEVGFGAFEYAQVCWSTPECKYNV